MCSVLTAGWNVDNARPAEQQPASLEELDERLPDDFRDWLGELAGGKTHITPTSLQQHIATPAMITRSQELLVYRLATIVNLQVQITMR